MTSGVIKVKFFRHITQVKFFNIRFYSDSAVRVRFAPSPTG